MAGASSALIKGCSIDAPCKSQPAKQTAALFRPCVHTTALPKQPKQKQQPPRSSQRACIASWNSAPPACPCPASQHSSACCIRASARFDHVCGTTGRKEAGDGGARAGRQAHRLLRHPSPTHQRILLALQRRLVGLGGLLQQLHSLGRVSPCAHLCPGAADSRQSQWCNDRAWLQAGEVRAAKRHWAQAGRQCSASDDFAGDAMLHVLPPICPLTLPPILPPICPLFPRPCLPQCVASAHQGVHPWLPVLHHPSVCRDAVCQQSHRTSTGRCPRCCRLGSIGRLGSRRQRRFGALLQALCQTKQALGVVTSCGGQCFSVFGLEGRGRGGQAVAGWAAVERRQKSGGSSGRRPNSWRLTYCARQITRSGYDNWTASKRVAATSAPPASEPRPMSRTEAWECKSAASCPLRRSARCCSCCPALKAACIARLVRLVWQAFCRLQRVSERP